MVFARIRLYLRIRIRYWRDAVMWGDEWAKKEYSARMHSFWDLPRDPPKTKRRFAEASPTSKADDDDDWWQAIK
jgi:hypothetical protein